MNYKQEIESYGKDLQDYQTSPFELIETFHTRTKLHYNYDQLDADDKELLKKHDQHLLDTAKKVYEHVKDIYDFKNGKPKNEWWWSLDEVVGHQLSIDLDSGIVTKTYLSKIVDFASKEEYDQFLNWSQDKQIVVREKVMDFRK